MTNKKRMEGDFKRGAKTSSSLMATGFSSRQLFQFMETSFYLPVDVLKNKNWQILPINVITGKTFAEKFKNKDEVHCLEGYELLCDAQFVAISTRRHIATNIYIYVAKLWYGEAP